MTLPFSLKYKFVNMYVDENPWSHGHDGIAWAEDLEWEKGMTNTEGFQYKLEKGTKKEAYIMS